MLNQSIRKKIALLTSCILIAGSVTSANISAEENLVLIRDDSGEVQLITENTAIDSESYYGIKITYIKGEHGEVISQNERKEIYYLVTTAEGLPSDSSVLDSLSEINPSSIAWEEDFKNWFSETYPEGSRLYAMSYNEFNLAKKLCMRYDSVIDTFCVWAEYEIPVYWGGLLNVTYKNDFDDSDIIGYLYNEDGNLVYRNLDGEIQPLDFTPSDEILQALLNGSSKNPTPVCREGSLVSAEAFQAIHDAESVGKEWLKTYQNWLDSVDSENMTPAELEASRISAGVPSDYEMLEKAYALCDEIMEQYGDELISVTPNVWHKVAVPDSTFYRPQTVWDRVGDTDENGDIDARDAFQLLQKIASAGAVPNSIYENMDDKKYKQEFWDVNADNFVNAQDAALILQYLAEKGTGKTDSIKDFMKEKTT